MTDRLAGSALRRAQIRTLVRLEMRKLLRGRRALPGYILAFLPIPLFAVMALLPVQDWVDDGLSGAARVYGIVFQTFILRALIFFGCVGVFSSLFRGEVLDRTLHYLFLSPVKRETLVAGKYLAGLMTTWMLFGMMIVTTYFLLHVPFGWNAATKYFFSGPGAGHLAAYLGVAALACIGYGSVFLLLGLLFRNPVLPAAAVLGWELLNFLLPPALKRLSVIHYLKGMLPMPMSEGPFAVVVESPPALLSMIGLVIFTLVVLLLSAWRLGKFQIHYAD